VLQIWIRKHLKLIFNKGTRPNEKKSAKSGLIVFVFTSRAILVRPSFYFEEAQGWRVTAFVKETIREKKMSAIQSLGQMRDLITVPVPGTLLTPSVFVILQNYQKFKQ
jgi:hypothetical protein